MEPELFICTRFYLRVAKKTKMVIFFFLNWAQETVTLDFASSHSFHSVWLPWAECASVYQVLSILIAGRQHAATHNTISIIMLGKKFAAHNHSQKFNPLTCKSIGAHPHILEACVGSERRVIVVVSTEAVMCLSCLCWSAVTGRASVWLDTAAGWPAG